MTISSTSMPPEDRQTSQHSHRVSNFERETEMNALLISPVNGEVVKKAVFATGNIKAPGEDGLTGLFFQRFWSILENDIFDAVNSFFTGGPILQGINHTILTLIPKVKQVQSMADLRPIGLYNVFL